MISRRSFLRSAALALPTAYVSLIPSTQAIPPINREGKARMASSLAAYSFRDYFPNGSGEPKINLFQFIDYCADHGLNGTELTSYYFPKDLKRDYLLQIRRHAFLRGIEISGTAVGNTFTHPPGEQRQQQIDHVKQWIDHAAVMGAPHIRIFAGNKAQGHSLAESKRFAVDCIHECAEYAAQHGIMLGLENHGGIVAQPEDLLDIVKAVQNPWFGINLDTGNFHTADPYADLALCAPYAVNAQIKVEMRPRGQDTQPADLPRLIQLLRNANYQGYVALEYEAKPSPWDTVPNLLSELKTLLAEPR